MSDCDMETKEENDGRFETDNFTDARRKWLNKIMKNKTGFLFAYKTLKKKDVKEFAWHQVASSMLASSS